MVEGGAFYNQGNQQQHGRWLTYRKKEAQTFDSERFCWRVRAVVSHNTPFNWPFLFLFFIVPYWYWVRLMFFVSRFPVFLFILRLLAIACGCCCGGAYRGGGRHPHLQPSTGWEKTTWPPSTWSGWKELRITLRLAVLLKNWHWGHLEHPKISVSTAFSMVKLPMCVLSQLVKSCQHKLQEVQLFQPSLDIESSKTSWKWITIPVSVN